MNKKTVFISILFLLAGAAILALTACDDLSGIFLPESNSISEQVVRIHIRANSNDADDQAVKLAVRDEITAYLTGRLEGCADKTDALKVLEGEEENLRQIAQNTLYRNGYDYNVRVSLSHEHFPERTYDGYVFPEGEYDALMILLGEGTGDNWWCVAFPPLCFVPDGNGEKITYKSWVAEKLAELFG